MNDCCKYFSVFLCLFCAIFLRALGSVWHSLDEFYKHLLLYFDYSFRRSTNVQTNVEKNKTHAIRLSKNELYTAFQFFCFYLYFFPSLCEINRIRTQQKQQRQKKEVQLF